MKGEEEEAKEVGKGAAERGGAMERARRERRGRRGRAAAVGSVEWRG